MDHHLCGHVPRSKIEEGQIGEIEGLPVVKLGRRDLLQAVAAGTALAVMPGCSTNPETGARQFILVSEGAMSQLAASSWADLRKKEPTLTGTSYNRRLEQVGRRIALASGRENQKWDYAVFDSDTRNAFVLPGNRVGFFKGMMDFTDNDDQLAAIVGHEVGHVSGRHAAERYSQALSGQLVIAGASVVGAQQAGRRCNSLAERYRSGGFTRAEVNEINNCRRGASRNTQLATAALGAGLTFGIILPFSRKHELEADILGAKYMQSAGYDPYQSVRLWKKMAASSKSRTPSFLSTHPDPNYRAQNLDRYIKSQGW